MALALAAAMAGCAWMADAPDGSGTEVIRRNDYGDSTQTGDYAFVASLPKEHGFAAAWVTRDTKEYRKNGLVIARMDSNGILTSSRKDYAADSIQYLMPRISAFPGGGFIVAWSSDGPTAIQGHAYFRIVGNRHETDNPVEPYFPEFRYIDFVSVTTLPDSGFALAVTGYDSTSEYCIRVRRFDPAGAPAGPIKRIYTGRETGQPELIDREGGGWMLAWKTLDSTGRIMGWQPFDDQGNPAGEARSRKIDQWHPHFRMRHLPEGRIYIEEDGFSPGLVVDAQGVPDAKFGSLPPYMYGLMADSAHGRFYGLEQGKIDVLDGNGRLLGSRTADTGDDRDGILFLNPQGNLVYFTMEFMKITQASSRGYLQSQVLKPF
ncbi:MAG: hypothetical protein JWP91_3762 [Fibrobacteres bacterium]|nr:hypothetical protein [Fibrobacterota bacterium]